MPADSTKQPRYGTQGLTPSGSNVGAEVARHLDRPGQHPMEFGQAEELLNHAVWYFENEPQLSRVGT